MRKLKKLVSLFLVLSLCLILCSCSKNNIDNTSSLDTVSQSDNTTGITEESTLDVDPMPVEASNGFTCSREPLPLQEFTVSDPENTKGLNNKTITHSYGVAKNGQPNNISVNAQKFFDSKGYDAFCLDTKSTEKVLYLTFDCGYENGYTSKILDVLKEKGVNAAFFCTLHEVK